MTINVISNIFEQNKLTEPNYNDWLRNLKIVLRLENKEYVLDTEPPSAPAANAKKEEFEKYQRHIDDDRRAYCFMLASMSNKLQRQNEDQTSAYSILQRLQKLYADKIREQMYATSNELFRCHMIEGSSIQDHGLKIIALIERLKSLGIEARDELFTDLMLQSLPPSFDSFVVNFNMHNMEKSPSELLNMLKTVESTMKRDKPVMPVGSSSKSKAAKSKNKKWKGKGSSNTNSLKANGGIKKKNSQANDKCHYYEKPGHWKRNCKDYLASLKRSDNDKK